MTDARAHQQTAEEIAALRDDLKQLRGDVTHLLNALKGEGNEKLDDLRQRFETAIRDKAEAIRAKAHTVGEAVAESTCQAKQTVEEHPFTTALVALCVGLVTGAILKGHKH